MIGTMASNHDFSSEDLQKAIQESILDLSFEEQVKVAEERSIEEERLKQLSFEEDIKKAKEMSFYQKHFSYDPVSIYEQQTDLAQKRLNAEHRKPFDREIRKAIELSQNEAALKTDQSGSDSDSGFASEDRDMELAMLRSQDPSEHESQEDKDLVLALRLSKLKDEDTSSVEFSSSIPNNYSSSQGSSDNDRELWLYEQDVTNPASGLTNPRGGLTNPLTLDDLPVNDQILLNQLEVTEANYSPLTPEELETLRPFLPPSNPVKPVKPAQGFKPFNPEVKSLDELEAELVGGSRKNKKKKRSQNSGSNSPAPSSGFGSPGARSSPVSQNRETGARPKLTNPSLGAVRNRLDRSSSTGKNNSDFSNYKMSPRQSPDMFTTVTTKKSSTTKSTKTCFATPAGKSGSAGVFRPIIVDGCNVSYQHGKNDRFSAKGMKIVYDYFVERLGYTNENIFIVYRDGGKKTQADLDMIESLYKIDVLVKTVSSKIYSFFCRSI